MRVNRYSPIIQIVQIFKTKKNQKICIQIHICIYLYMYYIAST